MCISIFIKIPKIFKTGDTKINRKFVAAQYNYFYCGYLVILSIEKMFGSFDPTNLPIPMLIKYVVFFKNKSRILIKSIIPTLETT